MLEFKDLPQKSFIFLVAVLTITIVSKSSLIYPFNDWEDANCFFTVGKSILSGLIPYRDLYEQKGPLLYFLHAIAACISYNSFLGVYFLEIICCYYFLLFFYKILKLYTNNEIIISLPIIAAIIYTSAAFANGDSVEELCLPLLVYSLYTTISALKKNELPTSRQCFFIGIIAACVLWMKFTILGFYFGIIICPCIFAIRNSQVIPMLMRLFCALMGVLALTIPILLFFSYHDALRDLFQVYFFNNIFLYSSIDKSLPMMSLVENLWQGLLRIIDVNFLSFNLIILGIVYLYKKEHKYIIFHFLLTLLFLFITVYIGGRTYRYYALIFSVFAAFGIIFIFNKIKIIYSKEINKFTIHFFISGILFCIFNCNNIYLLKYNKSEMPQYKFKKIVDNSGIKNPTMLNYGFLDGGFYTISGIVPNCKYFCGLNINLDKIKIEQDNYIRNKKIDFIVVNNATLSTDNYYVVDTFSFYLEGVMEKYTIYALKSRLP